MALPNEYTRVEYIESSGTQYINTGVSPASYLNSLKIVADAQYTTIPSGSSATAFIFGTGYYNSTTTNRRTIFAGKRGSTSTSNFAFLSGAALGTAVAFSGATLDTNRHIFSIDQVNGLYGFDDDTQSFSTTVNSNLTETLKIFCGHASGTSGNPLSGYASARLYSFQIYDNDTLIRDFIPVKRDSDSVYGLYDLANDVFYENQGTGSFTGGDEVYEIIVNASPSNGGTVTGGGLYTLNDTVTLTATASSRFTFSGWSDGVATSTRTITVTEDAEYVALFTKPKVVIGDEYRLWAKKREQADQLPIFFTNVMSADISEDLLQKATSTIVCVDDCSVLEPGDIVAVRDGKNNVVYDGVVSSVEGNTISCGQMQSFFDVDYYAMADSSAEKNYYGGGGFDYTPLIKLNRYTNDLQNGRTVSKFTVSGGSPSYMVGNDPLIGAWYNRVFALILPRQYWPVDFTYGAMFQASDEEINIEEMLYEYYSMYEIIPRFFNVFDAFIPQPNLNENESMFCFFFANTGMKYPYFTKVEPYETINLGDFAEFISNIVVTTEAEDTNVLYVFDSGGTTLRQRYAIFKDGTYDTAFNLADISKRFEPPKISYVESDDDLTAILKANLKQVQYNHKVNFTFDLNNNFYDFGDINLGQNISFYVGDKLYNSVLTGWSYHIEQGKMLKDINMVCGKVRNNLTSKLNLGKVK